MLIFLACVRCSEQTDVSSPSISDRQRSHSLSSEHSASEASSAVHVPLSGRPSTPLHFYSSTFSPRTSTAVAAASVPTHPSHAASYPVYTFASSPSIVSSLSQGYAQSAQSVSGTDFSSALSNTFP